jgi:hypothetical protein
MWGEVLMSKATVSIMADCMVLRVGDLSGRVPVEYVFTISEAHTLIDQLQQGIRTIRLPEEYSHPETCNCPLCSTPETGE